MEAMDLLLDLEGIKEIWTGHAYLDLDDDGRPVLRGWYHLNKDDDSINVEYIIENSNPLIWRKIT